MRHQRSGKKLGRDSAHRRALYSNLAGALIEHGRIKTTEAKAKAVKPIAEQMITLGRRGDLHARRQALVVPALAGRRAQALRRRRPALRRPSRRLLADRQARPAPGRRRRDGLPRARRLRARRDTGPAPAAPRRQPPSSSAHAWRSSSRSCSPSSSSNGRGACSSSSARCSSRSGRSSAGCGTRDAARPRSARRR